MSRRKQEVQEEFPFMPPKQARPSKQIFPKPPKPPVDEDEVGGAPSIPEITEIADSGTADLAVELLAEAQALHTRHKEDEARLKDIKTALSTVAEAWELSGVRSGNFGMEYHGLKTKRSLDRAKLIENGVDPEVIKASYTESDEFISTRFRVYKL